EEGRVWLLLPHCPPNAAAKIARDICQSFSEGQDQASYDLYHYAAGDKGTDENRSCQNSRSENHSADGGDCRDSSDTSPLESPSETEAVEPLVARAMPRSKRALDLILAGIALVVFAPVL